MKIGEHGQGTDFVAKLYSTPPLRKDSRAPAIALQGAMDTVSINPEAGLYLSQEVLETEIGKKVSELFEKAGVKLSDAVGIDFSPKATATRIFDFSTGMLGIWRAQNPNLSEEELMDSFEKTIRGAVDDGYSQAMNILEGMGLADAARGTAEETMSLLDQMFDHFFGTSDEDKAAVSAPPAPAEERA